ncbi:hypothetical protein [Anaerophilus nitritogenes]|uniref:hypothetical protein n=1 Tax=Anaerophilus nitritogenes TaxID=2498136 RepID=UPI00101C5789|nr:hypothetical protein [Anaerophilus nitritogenes]
MMKSGVSYKNLIVDLPVKLYKITNLKIEQGLNNHASAYITGILDEAEKSNAIYNLNIQTNIKIKIKTEYEEEVIFSGVPVNISIQHIDDVYYIYIVLNSHSIHLDFKVKSRSFQDKYNPYTNIFKEVIKEYDGYILDMATKGALQNSAIIQYEETDWEFIKRVASHVGAKIFSEIKSDKPKIYIGMNSGNSYKEKNHNYIIEKKIKEYLNFEKNYGSFREKDMLFYTVESLENYELGDKITYKKVVFVVVEKISELVKGILIHRYKLQKEQGIKQNILYNKKIKGVSIDGKVLAREKDKLKLHLSIDTTQSINQANWYQLDTSYTTEGKTGFYSTPQIGDSVNLYIKGTDEREAYVKSVNRLDGEENPKVQDPSTKYYGTIHGKEMKLGSKELSFSTVENVLYIKMADETGVEVTSNNDIQIKTENKMYVECESMEVESKDKIILATRESSIIVDQVVHIKR